MTAGPGSNTGRALGLLGPRRTLAGAAVLLAALGGGCARRDPAQHEAGSRLARALDPAIDQDAHILLHQETSRQVYASLIRAGARLDLGLPQVIPPPAEPSAADDPRALAVSAILIESVLLDAREELVAAGRALREDGTPATALAWLTEPPPWPPASVQKLLDREDRSGDVLVSRLAQALAPDPAARDELLRSWLEPRRTVDAAFLHALAHMAGGKLAAEPRLRDWLRAEWTAWARQRYRRVARKLAEPKAGLL